MAKYIRPMLTAHGAVISQTLNSLGGISLEAGAGYLDTSTGAAAAGQNELDGDWNGWTGPNGSWVETGDDQN
jgi:hypothetical protein